MSASSNQEIKGEEGIVTQLGFVVRDIDEKMEHYSKILGVKPWDVYTFSPETGVRNFKWKGEEVEDFEFKIALAKFGGVQFELIEPVKNVPIYQDFLREKGEGIHHIKQMVRKENKEESIENFKKHGLDPICGGNIDEDYFTYFGTEDELGVIWEIGNSGDIREPERRYPSS